MIDELSNLLDEFPGPANQTRCFAHVLNLVVKSVIRQFDVPKAQADHVFDNATTELLKLAGDLENEEMQTLLDLDGDDDTEDDNNEGWVDERTLMSEEELEELEETVQPIRLLLTKVRNHLRAASISTDDTLQLRKVAFAIKNSTTIILPKWLAILDELCLRALIMPRDVATRWNSTFDMLDFAVEHIDALNAITGDREMKLRRYELSEEDWTIATQLRDVLKVRLLFVL